MSEEMTIRTYRAEDLPALVDLINAVEAEDKLELGTTLETMEREMSWPGYEPDTDCFLAWAGDRLVGYSDLFLRKGPDRLQSIFYIYGMTHPDWRRRGVGRRLLERTYARALERLPEAPPGAVHFQGGARDRETGHRALYESLGMAPARYFVEMVRALNGDLPEVEVPHGYRLRTYEGERDLERAWGVDTRAFAEHWGFGNLPLSEFRHLLEMPDYRPGLSLLVEEEQSGEAVGLALNRINPEWLAQTGRKEGVVGTLGVLREHRHRGLGTALLAQSLHTLRREGMDSALLWADSENETGAVRLYERVGFKVRKTTISYRRTMRDG